MKHATVKLLFMALIVMMVAASAFPACAAGAKRAYVVNTGSARDRLYVHSTAGSGDVKDYLKNGTVVLVFGTEKGWWKVMWRKANGTFGKGYIDGRYTVAIDADRSMKFTGVDNLYAHSTNKIASGACGQYHLGVIPRGYKFTVVKQDGTWAYVTNGKKGAWVSSIYLVRVK